MPYRGDFIAVEFDFLQHELHVTSSRGERRSFRLEAMSVAEFFQRTMTVLRELGVEVNIHARPVEVAEAIPFALDTKHASYDAEAVHRFWRALVQVDRVFTDFRARFVGKASPVHFFWGAFDLAVTRFSGRTAPKHPGGIPNCPNWVMDEAYSHEVSSAGFWPGTPASDVAEASFYSYAYPVSAGFAEYSVQPEAAYYHQTLGEFVLPYEAVRMAENPDQTLLTFLQTTYEAAATTAKWDRARLER
jgi:hypothetical protein